MCAHGVVPELSIARSFNLLCDCALVNSLIKLKRMLNEVLQCSLLKERAQEFVDSKVVELSQEEDGVCILQRECGVVRHESPSPEYLGNCYQL